ncbi:Anaphase-promoting complex subunit 2 [Diplonema papillatum]|nr:Anaphase-promoting complex subunit 2 [Diplonema papillatum]|eukprot:gene22146-33980_t
MLVYDLYDEKEEPVSEAWLRETRNACGAASGVSQARLPPHTRLTMQDVTKEGWILECGKQHVRQMVAAVSGREDEAQIEALLHAIDGFMSHFEATFGAASAQKLRLETPAMFLYSSGTDDMKGKLVQKGLKDLLRSCSDASCAARAESVASAMQNVGLYQQPFLLGLSVQIFEEALTAGLEEVKHVLDEHKLSGLLSLAAETNATWRWVTAEERQKLREQMEHTTHLRFGKLRASEFFDILVEYPDSRPALLDLKQCLVDIPELYAFLVASARQQLSRRLLHAGAKTEIIIQVYIDAMKAVDLLFPGQHKAVDAITGTIQNYLRQRKDGTTLFVLGLIDDSSSQLASILHPELHVRRSELYDVEEEDILENGKGQQQHIRRLDVLKRLVNTFGSRDNVLALYRSVLAEKLVARTGFDTDSEITALELLKVRFGESSLQNCEVMIKDVADSKRFCQVVHKSQSDQPAAASTPFTRSASEKMTALIQSKLYWPKLPTLEGFVAHPIVAAMQTAYEQQYAQRRQPRKLQWQPGVGTVSLSISVFSNAAGTERETVDITSTLHHATLLLHLAEAQSTETGGLTTEQLADKCGLAAPLVTQKMAHWTSSSMVSLEGAVYKCVAYKARQGVAVATEGDKECGAEIMAAEDHERNEMTKEFVRSILTNFGPADAPFIENKIRLFMPEYAKTQQQLVALLMTMVTADELSLKAGTFSMKI